MQNIRSLTHKQKPFKYPQMTHFVEASYQFNRNPALVIHVLPQVCIFN